LIDSIFKFVTALVQKGKDKKEAAPAPAAAKQPAPAAAPKAPAAMPGAMPAGAMPAGAMPAGAAGAGPGAVPGAAPAQDPLQQIFAAMKAQPQQADQIAMALLQKLQTTGQLTPDIQKLIVGLAQNAKSGAPMPM
jgi:hypothetical protein